MIVVVSFGKSALDTFSVSSWGNRIFATVLLPVLLVEKE